jgi:ABC-type uncharacterized transport system involved in gliding motility auxiliary subunit
MIQKVLGIVGWIGTALVFGAVAVRFVRPEWDQYAIYAAWAGLACVILYTLGQWRDIVEYFRRRQARYGALATVSVLVALGIVVAVNYLSTRENKRWDLTATKQNSLSEQTIKVLKALDAPVTFTAFDRQTDLDRFRTRLDEYAYQSKQISTAYVDPDTKPVVAKEYQIDQYGTVVVEYKGRRERATSDNEQDLTNALIKLVSGMERNVYFVQGHGEKDPSKTERDGYSAVADVLKRDNYKVDKIVLAQQKEVPADASAVIVAGPTSDLLPEETDALRRYMTRAGKVMVLVDPLLEGGGKAFPKLQAFVKEWGIDLANNVVVDVSGATNEPSLAVAANYPPHAITDRFSTLTVYPLARAIQVVSGGTNGHIAQPLVETSARSWAETNFATLSTGAGVKMEPEQGDTAGPVTLAAAASAPATVEGDAKPADDAPKPESRLVVFGDSDFPSNAYGGIAGNPNLFANAVNWLAQQENLIAIRPKEAGDRRVTMTARQQQAVGLISILIVPALVFGTGVWTWWRRR